MFGSARIEETAKFEAYCFNFSKPKFRSQNEIMISNLNSIDDIFMQGKVVAVFKHVTATTEGSYTCSSEGVSSKEVKVYVGE